ncbi:Clavaminate synthase-like protein [Phlegmacium glaucopus]|nr:Clavaminate synthase-like protein [Phlegmacium glaucopus]
MSVDAAAFAEQIGQRQAFVNIQQMDDLRQAASDLAAGINQNECADKCLQLMNFSYEQMRNLGNDDSSIYIWRSLYTDSCILRAFAVSRQSLLLAISTLDRAIIIAGPFGDGRLDLILGLIRNFQLPLSQHYVVKAMSPSPIVPTPFKCTIPQLSSPPTFLTFQSQYSRQPFILRGYAQDWPAVCDRPWRSAAYLRSVAGPGRLVPVEIGKDYRLGNWKQELMDWADFLSTIDFDDQPSFRNEGIIFYLAQHDLIKQFPALREDFIVPDYVYASLPCADYPDYRPPQHDYEALFNAWLGPKGAMSPAHTDPYHNCYVQVVGYKSVWLAPPSVSALMHPFRHSQESGQSMDIDELKMGNTSRLDVFSSDGNKEISGQVVPSSMTATLGPGDMLFLPAGWWHAMRSESTSFSISMWF